MNQLTLCFYFQGYDALIAHKYLRVIILTRDTTWTIMWKNQSQLMVGRLYDVSINKSKLEGEGTTTIV